MLGYRDSENYMDIGIDAFCSLVDRTSASRYYVTVLRRGFDCRWWQKEFQSYYNSDWYISSSIPAMYLWGAHQCRGNSYVDYSGEVWDPPVLYVPKKLIQMTLQLHWSCHGISTKSFYEVKVLVRKKKNMNIMLIPVAYLCLIRQVVFPPPTVIHNSSID